RPRCDRVPAIGHDVGSARPAAFRHVRSTRRDIRRGRVRRPSGGAARYRGRAHRLAARRQGRCRRRCGQGRPAMTSRTQRNVIVTLVALALVILVINLIARGLDSAVGGSQPGGASGSSYATNGGGLSAYAQLLADYGHPVQRQRGNLGSRVLDPSATLILTGSDRPVPLQPDELDT